MPRCEATVTTPDRVNTGGQCRRNAVRGTTHCERHGGVEDAEADGKTVKRPPSVFRQLCTATKRDGTPCSKWAMRGGFVCRNHGGNLPSVQKAAKQRLQDMLPLALRELYSILEDEGTAATDKLRAITVVLDRTGLGTQSEVTVEMKPWERLVGDTTVNGIYRRLDEGESAALQPTPGREVVDAYPLESDRQPQQSTPRAAAGIELVATPMRRLATAGRTDPPRHLR